EGDKLVIFAAVTVKATPLLAMVPTVTTTLPVVAPVGTAALMLVAFQELIVVAVVPLKVTVLAPWLGPKLVPVMVTVVPAPPDVSERLVMLGAVAKTWIGERQNRKAHSTETRASMANSHLQSDNLNSQSQHPERCEPLPLFSY